MKLEQQKLPQTKHREKIRNNNEGVLQGSETIFSN